MTGPILVTLLLVTLVAVAIWLFLRRAAEQRAAHDARLKAMAQAFLVAAKKKQAAKATGTAEPAPPAVTTMRDERECPFCAEPILKKARVCKHCRRDVEPVA